MVQAEITATSYNNNAEDVTWPDLISPVDASCSHSLSNLLPMMTVILLGSGRDELIWILVEPSRSVHCINTLIKRSAIQQGSAYHLL